MITLKVVNIYHAVLKCLLREGGRTLLAVLRPPEGAGMRCPVSEPWVHASADASKN